MTRKIPRSLDREEVSSPLEKRAEPALQGAKWYPGPWFVVWVLATGGFAVWVIKNWGVASGRAGGFSITPLGITYSAIWLFLALASYAAQMAYRRLTKPVLPARDAEGEKGETQESLQYIVPEPPDSLIDACARGEFVLFAGSGVSAAAGFPTWEIFVRNLVRWSLENRFINSERAKSFEAALAIGKSSAVADSIVEALSDHATELHQFLSDVFLRRGFPRLPTHSLLFDLRPSAVVTTNLDDLMDRTFSVSDDRVLTPKQPERLVELLSKRDFFLLKLYGTPRNPDSLLLSPGQYGDEMNRNLIFSEFMDSLFLSRTLFFVGASLEGIENYLAAIRFRGYRARSHFALVALSGTAWKASADSLARRYGIEVLPYSPTQDYPEVADFLSKLLERVRERVGSVGRDAGPAREGHKGEPLKSVRLENIGPFKEFEWNLTPGWNVLLGDNGVGKSTILRAIALGICGRDGQAYAGRLIRSEPMVTKATIVLRTERHQYITELRRKSDTEAELSSPTARPLDAEGWLALGFPPLRAMTWKPAEAPQRIEASRAVPADLLPLLEGGPDPRLDRLKQWLVNLDYLIHSDKNGKRYATLRDQFFAVVDKLTPGVSVKFDRVDPGTKKVTVVTADGIVPIEAVSQGTTSLLGWIGVLLQRIYEVYGDEEDPLDRYCIVLIDEIDAHMHPEWQQKLVYQLGALFPKIQFIATTHSPLIVGGMAAGNIQRLVRDQEGRVIQMDNITDLMTAGRVDQILTTPLFGLESARDALTAATLARYTELAAKDKLNAKEDEQLRKDAAFLKTRLPSPLERERSRKAFALLQSALDDHLSKLPEQEAKSLMDEVKVQIQESISGSRRPE